MAKSKKVNSSGTSKIGRNRDEHPRNHLSHAVVPGGQSNVSSREYFSLHDAIRHTDKHRSEPQTGTNFRNHSVRFVKSSALPEEHKQLESTMTTALADASNDVSGRTILQDTHKRKEKTKVDINSRPTSPSPSNSSAEVVYFTGRDKQKHRHESLLGSCHHGQYNKPTYRDKSTFHSKTTRTTTRQPPVTQGLEHLGPELMSQSLDSEEAFSEHGENVPGYGGPDDDCVLQARWNDMDLDGWAMSDIADFDDFSTSDDTPTAIEIVLSKRVRPSGQHYLVVGKGQSIDEARWVNIESLTSPRATALIQEFEEQKTSFSDSASAKDKDLDSDGTTNGVQSNGGSNRNSEQIEIEQMTDEQIARLLSKQEELGMGSDELLLFDGANSNLDEFEKTSNYVPLHHNFGKKGQRKNRSRLLRKTNDCFLGSVEDMLDEDYKDLAFMEMIPARSIETTPSYDEFGFGLSDPELEQELHEQYAADRRKKKARKQQREELRAQGLLGNKNKFKPDMSARYNEGLIVSNFEDELRDFLSNENSTLGLPPMNKHERKTIHEIASQFNLKSKSVGSGKSRFPVLYKTSRTLDFDAMLFKRIESRIGWRLLPRMDKRSKFRSSNSLRRSVGGGNVSGTAYAEGETVGASAPELSSDNRGRAMLEKMGWSTGMGLGALDNTGILQPIPHVVKKTRAGLG